MAFKKSNGVNSAKDLTKMRTPHTYAIIFFVVLFCWILTFIVPAGRFSVHDIEYKGAAGETKTRTVLMPETFRYSYDLNAQNLSSELTKLSENTDAAKEAGVDQGALQEFVKTDSTKWSQSDLDDLGLTDDVLYKMFGESIYDTNNNLHNTA